MDNNIPLKTEKGLDNEKNIIVIYCFGFIYPSAAK